ncbi:MAG: hypothetical protein P4L38_06295 [Syntrophaceae bacterium]|nr:hypothetical protein [Syntrophaceae bacterium]
MVKRTLVVLSILSLTLMVAGTSFGFMGGGCGSSCAPLYVPVDCPDTGVSKTIVKTWECKIEGPCPAPMPGCGSSCNNLKGPKPGLLCCLAGVVGAPFDAIFGGFGGVYGCNTCFGGGGGCGSGGGRGCGSPFLGGLSGVFGSGATMLSGETTVFGALW